VKQARAGDWVIFHHMRLPSCLVCHQLRLKAEQRYEANRFSVTRQLRYSTDETLNALDFGLFILERQHKAVFDSIIVVTDRRLLDDGWNDCAGNAASSR
jgi:hypothetical protein